MKELALVSVVGVSALLLSCDDNRVSELEHELSSAEERISELEQQLAVELENSESESTEDLASDMEATELQSPARTVAYTLLVDSNNVGTFNSRAECEAAAAEVNREADAEQEARMEHNRRVQSGEIPPNVIYGNALRANTQCLRLAQQ